MPLNQSHRDTFGVNSSSEERRLPRVDVFLTLTGQLQLTVVLVHIPVDGEHEYRWLELQTENFLECSLCDRCCSRTSVRCWTAQRCVCWTWSLSPHLSASGCPLAACTSSLFPEEGDIETHSVWVSLLEWTEMKEKLVVFFSFLFFFFLLSGLEWFQKPLQQQIVLCDHCGVVFFFNSPHDIHTLCVLNVGFLRCRLEGKQA